MLLPRPVADRPAAPPVAVISDAFWEREFDRSPTALGQSLELNHASVTIIGVAPPQFFGETVGNAPDIWLPIVVQPQVMPGDWLNAPSSSWLSVLARLHPGVSARQAGQALEAVYQPLAGLGHQQQKWRTACASGRQAAESPNCRIASAPRSG